jgi:hypothetical protein
VVIAYLAKQLGIASPSCLARYRERVETHHAHATEIERRHGYRDFHQQPRELLKASNPDFLTLSNITFRTISLSLTGALG